MLPNPSLEHLAAIAEKHLTIKQQRDLYYKLISASPRLIDWLGRVPDRKKTLEYVHLGADWMKIAFNRLEEEGQRTSHMKEFEALSQVVRDSLRPEMTDLALYRQMKRFPGLLTNSMCFPFTDGQVVITPTDYRAKKYPFDFVSISDNGRRVRDIGGHPRPDR